jgi:galactokinase
VVWCFRELGHPITGLDICVDSQVPIGAGLSSSAALECAVGLALRDLFAPQLSLPDLARICQRAENLYVGVPSGIMDQTASLCCTEGHAIVFDTRSGEIEQVSFDLVASGLQLLVIDTLVRHELSSSAYADRRAACERAAAVIGVSALRDAVLADLEKVTDLTDRRRARHVITEDARVLEVAELLRESRLREVGPILSAAHESLRTDFEVTCPELDVAAEQAVASGAYGARMIGGGFGGCVVALAERDDCASIEASVAETFAEHGFLAPRCFTATPARGAYRAA